MADPVVVTKVEDVGSDVLQVTATRGKETLLARGWVSATKSTYDPAAYSRDKLGNLIRDSAAQPRAMTAAEVGQYALQLVRDQNPEAAAPPAPKPVPFA